MNMYQGMAVSRINEYVPGYGDERDLMNMF